MSIDLVLCATDLSLEEGAAWRSAAQLVQAFNARVRIVHVIEPVVFPYASEGPALEKLRSELLSEARRAVHARLASLQQEWAAGYRPEKIEAVMALEGPAAQMILLEAEQVTADMILLFNRRRGSLRRLLPGSVAQQVVSEARIPVLVLPIADGKR